jgi:hypothetical protein
MAADPVIVAGKAGACRAVRSTRVAIRGLKEGYCKLQIAKWTLQIADWGER